jgi:hypothetical protein
MNLQASNKFLPIPKSNRGSISSYAGLNLGKKPWAEQHSGDNSNCAPDVFIEKSNNFYHSLILFLGSYPKSRFRKDSTLSLANVLTRTPNSNNVYPRLELNKIIYSLNNYPNGWPKSGSTFYGNEQSILSHALSTNYNLATHDLDKEDTRLRTQTRIAFADEVIYDSLHQKGTEAFLYAFPEESYFLQKERTAPEPLLNTLVGLRNPTAGGAPWEVSPLKMAEFYARLATQKNITAQIAPKNKKYQTLQADSSWNGKYSDFLKNVIFRGMKKVIITGTAADLARTMAMRNGIYKGYHLYAKTGTIGNEGARFQSKRLALIISKVDLEKEGSSDQVYILYLSGQAINTANNEVYRKIIDAVIESEDFKKYMNP